MQSVFRFSLVVPRMCFIARLFQIRKKKNQESHYIWLYISLDSFNLEESHFFFFNDWLLEESRTVIFYNFPWNWFPCFPEVALASSLPPCIFLSTGTRSGGLMIHFWQERLTGDASFILLSPQEAHEIILPQLILFVYRLKGVTARSLLCRDMCFVRRISFSTMWRIYSSTA